MNLIKKTLLIGVVLISLASEANCQIFKFNHILEQDDIQNANFTLHRKGTQLVHPPIPLTSAINHKLTKGLLETITTTVPAQVTSTQPLRVRRSLAFSGSTTLTPGILFSNIVEGTEFMVPANTPLIISPGNTFISSDLPNVEISISPIPPASNFPVGNEIKLLETSLVRLVAPTKGIISVSGGKILFDPWQITDFVTPLAGTIDIDKDTPVPLELLDGRTKISEPTKVLKVPYRHYTLSLNSIPFRYRGKRVLADTVHSTGTVTTAFSLALSLGHTWGVSSITTRARNDYSFTLGAFVGPSSVDLKKENVKHPLIFEAGRTNPVLSYGINTIFARNGFGLLFAAGLDNAFGKYGNDWIYDNDIWFGLGISASFPK